MRRVLVGTPSHSGAVDVYYAHSIGESIRLCVQRAIDLRPVYMAYDSLVQNARNDIVALAIEHKFDDLIFIDADQEWNPEWIPALLNYPVDCVGSAVRKKTDQAELYNVRARGGAHSFTKHPTSPILTTPDMALGCGFLRLSLRAVQALWDSSEPYTAYQRQTESRWIFDVRPIKAPGKAIAELNGEDTIVSDKLRALGIETWLDPAMTCGHVGVKKYEGDFAAWLAKLQAETPLPAA